MTLNGVTAFILRFFTEFDSFAGLLFIYSFIHYTIHGSHIKQSKTIKHKPYKEER